MNQKWLVTCGQWSKTVSVNLCVSLRARASGYLRPEEIQLTGVSVRMGVGGRRHRRQRRAEDARRYKAKRAQRTKFYLAI